MKTKIAIFTIGLGAGALVFLAAFSLVGDCRHAWGKWEPPQRMQTGSPLNYQYNQQRSCTNCGEAQLHVLWER